MDYCAHKTEDGRKQSISEHSNAVAELARQFSEPFGFGDYGGMGGKYHDTGKYANGYQRRLDGSSEKYEHSTAGMYLLAERGMREGQPQYMFAAQIIGGHHTGLPDFGTNKDNDSEGTFWGKYNRRKNLPVDYAAYKTELGEPETLRPLPKEFRNNYSAQFLTRMLFSALVDADFLDTERFMADGERVRETGGNIAALKTKLDAHMAKFDGGKGDINIKRAQILASCRAAAKSERGIYRLTVPTGGGKTLSSLTFALDHAAQHGLRRVIYVIPYVNIITQTVKIFSDALGEDNVLGHYSAAEYTPKEGEEVAQSELAAENWDKPVIVTTNVQFFESLHAARTSRCRKLHNIANSVIIFDEAQALPVEYLKPCINAVAELVKNYCCTAVLCTATQPSLDGLLNGCGIAAREIIPDVPGLYGFFKRATYKFIGRTTDETMTAMIRDAGSSLCILNSRAGAKEYYEALKGEGVYHLSTYMTHGHIKEKLKIITERLASGLPCTVISTSLVEAGVDLDFPAVFREETGLDSIIQAGGRCNREGKRQTVNSIVTVFRREKISRRVAAMLDYNDRINQKYTDISEPDAIKYYFDTLYREKNLDNKDINKLLSEQLYMFRTVADKFKLIENEQRQIFIPNAENAGLCADLRSGLRNRKLMREAAIHMVSIYPNEYAELRATGVLTEQDDIAILEDPDCYDNMTGLKIPKTGEALFD